MTLSSPQTRIFFHFLPFGRMPEPSGFQLCFTYEKRGARPEGLEPSTYGLEIRCSIRLSYGRKIVRGSNNGAADYRG